MDTSTSCIRVNTEVITKKRSEPCPPHNDGLRLKDRGHNKTASCQSANCQKSRHRQQLWVVMRHVMVFSHTSFMSMPKVPATDYGMAARKSQPGRRWERCVSITVGGAGQGKGKKAGGKGPRPQRPGAQTSATQTQQCTPPAVQEKRHGPGFGQGVLQTQWPILCVSSRSACGGTPRCDLPS